MPYTPIWALIFGCLALIALLVRRAYKRTALKHEAEAEKARADAATTRDDTPAARGFGRSEVFNAPDLSPASVKKAKEARLIARIVGYVGLFFALLAVILMVMASTVIVSTKTIGVRTAFKAPVGELDNGLHIIPPWEKVTELDGSVQTDNRVRKAIDENPPSCTTVRIAQQSTACVDNSIRWRIRPGAADRLFRDYKDFDNIRRSLVTSVLGATLTEVYKNYDPLATDKDGISLAPSQDSLSDSATTTMQGAVDPGIEVLSVIIPIQYLDPTTQGRLNDLQAEIGNTRIATQRKLTAIADAAANKELAASISKDPNVLVSKCFDRLGELIQSKQPVPAGFNCWPGSSSAIVVPATK